MAIINKKGKWLKILDMGNNKVYTGQVWRYKEQYLVRIYKYDTFSYPLNYLH